MLEKCFNVVPIFSLMLVDITVKWQTSSLSCKTCHASHVVCLLLKIKPDNAGMTSWNFKLFESSKTFYILPSSNVKQKFCFSFQANCPHFDSQKYLFHETPPGENDRPTSIPLRWWHDLQSFSNISKHAWKRHHHGHNGGSPITGCGGGFVISFFPSFCRKCLFDISSILKEQSLSPWRRRFL